MFDCLVCSPPYAEGEKGHPSLGSVNKDAWGTDGRDIARRRGVDGEYGVTNGQLGAMKSGEPPMLADCLVCSPPFQRVLKSTDKKFCVESTRTGKWAQNRSPESVEQQCAGYGTTFGQLGAMKPGHPCETPMNEVETLSWDKDSCYSLSWQGLITPESFAHPAKMARGQLFRLVRWLFETGRVRKGDTLIDPFGGISTTAIAGASAGLKVITCELEERFWKLGLENMEIHRRVWEAAGDPQPTCLLGDSRKLVEVVGPVLGAAVVSSPPFAGSLGDKPSAGLLAGSGRRMGVSQKNTDGYGTSPGQLGAMPPGNLPPGDALADGVVSSPPYEGSIDPRAERDREADRAHCGRRGRNPGSPGGLPMEEYGTTEGNVGNTSGETFWDAARQIVEQCHLLLKPGATTCWVVKSYVKAGKIVPFPDQWAALLESTGYKVTHRIRCHLVSETREADLFGGETVRRKERKSFFRRLHEKKSPHTRIDFEEIVIAVKVGEGGSAGAVVSSPPYTGDALGCGGGPGAYGPGNAAFKKNGGYKQEGNNSGSSGHTYGHTAGQLGGLPPGSPPKNSEK